MDKFTIMKRDNTCIAVQSDAEVDQFKRMGYLDAGQFESDSKEDAIRQYQKKRSNLKSQKTKANTNLIKCKDCDQEISKSAKTCPNCGKKQREYPWKTFFVLNGIFAFFIINAITSIFDPDDNKSSSSTGSYSQTTSLTSYDESKIKSIIINSDDYQKYEDSFLTASRALVRNGSCSLSSGSLFSKTGGWFKSTTTYANEPVYFTYCNPSEPPFPTTSDRIYLNVETNKRF